MDRSVLRRFGPTSLTESARGAPPREANTGVLPSVPPSVIFGNGRRGPKKSGGKTHSGEKQGHLDGEADDDDDNDDDG